MWPKIRDVAREAGVSLSTVSRVLNQTKHVEPELKRRVRDAVKKLQYQPDQHARWLSSKRSNVVGLIMPSVDTSNRATYLQSCSATLRSAGLEVMVGLTEGTRELEQELASAYVQSHASGIIFTTHRADGTTRALLAGAGIPVLFAWAEGSVGRAPLVRFDTASAVTSLVHSLRLEPTRRVWVLSGLRSQSEANARARAMVDALHSAGFGGIEELECDGSTASAYHETRERFDHASPDLLMCTSDYLAIGARRAVYEAGMRIPEDVALTGFGRTVYAAACLPSLTTVELDSTELGRVAGESMVGLVRGDDIPLIQEVGSRVIAGESCPVREEQWQR